LLVGRLIARLRQRHRAATEEQQERQHQASGNMHATGNTARIRRSGKMVRQRALATLLRI
jgi:hypothetical protein